MNKGETIFLREVTVMGYHPRIETNEYADLITSRTRNSELWFVNNQQLENAILGYTAKYATRHYITLYAFAIEGNHLHMVVQVNNRNRGDFMRDLKSSIARALPRYTPSHPGGNIWGRRYSNEFLPAPDDIEERFFYTVLQPVQDGLVEKISQYPGYNCFHDAIWGITRTFEIVNWTAYNEALRWNPEVKLVDFIETYTLECIFRKILATDSGN